MLERLGYIYLVLEFNEAFGLGMGTQLYDMVI
jgi:hypothetical protein